MHARSPSSKRKPSSTATAGSFLLLLLYRIIYLVVHRRILNCHTCVSRLYRRLGSHICTPAELSAMVNCRVGGACKRRYGDGNIAGLVNIAMETSHVIVMCCADHDHLCVFYYHSLVPRPHPFLKGNRAW